MLNGSLTSISYLNYEFLVAGINDTFQNLTHFLSLNPSMITTNFLAPDPFFELRYYSIDESKYINPKLCEMFFMYDESIGWSHPYFDGYDYSVSFICIFFPTSNIINELRINYQKTNSITTDKLTILCEEEVIGYIYAYHGENDVFDYVANYLKQNLVIL